MSMRFAKTIIGFIGLALLILPCILHAQEKPEIFVQMGHASSIQSVAVSPDGRQAISGSFDHVMKLWDVASGREVRTLTGHTGKVASIVFSPDGKHVLSGSADKTVRLWDAASGKTLRTFEGHTGDVTSVALSPDGKYALSGSGDKTLKLWDVASGREIRTIEASTIGVTSVAFSPDGKYAFAGSLGRNPTLKLWNLASGREVKAFEGNQMDVSSVAVSPDGRYVLSGGDFDKKLKLWDVASGKEIRTFAGHTGGVVSVAVSPDGKYALSGSHDYTMKLWEIASGREIKTFTGHTFWVNAVAFSPDGLYVLSGSDDKTLKLWDATSGKEVRAFQGHASTVNSGVFSPDGKYLLYASYDKTLKLWDAASGRQIKTFRGHTQEAVRAAFSPDGKQALSCSYDKTLKLWDVAAGREIRTFSGHTYGAFAIAFSPDGKNILSGSGDKTLVWWDAASGRAIKTFPGHTGWVVSAAVSPDGKYGLSGSYDKTLKLWDIAGGKEIRTFTGHTGYVNAVAFSPDGRYALSGSADHTLKLWDVEAGREVRTFRGHAGWVNSVAFSPDGLQILSGGNDGVKLWDRASGRAVKTFAGHTDAVGAAAFNPDGRYAFSGGSNGTTRIWNVASGKELIQLVGFNDGEWAAITPDGFFNASPAGASHLNVRVRGSVYGVDQFYAGFYRPELISLVLAGKELPRGESLGDVLIRKNAPTVQIISPVSGSTVDKDSVTLSLTIADNGGGIGDVKIYVNGSQVANETRGLTVKEKESVREKSLSFTLALVDGANEIKALAMNREGSMESSPAVVRVLSRAAMTRPNLYALVVGINEYKNKSIALTYAVPDALAFAETLQKTASPLFGKTDIQTLTTVEQTSKEAISRAFADLRLKVKPNDLFVFYNASHGIVDVVDNDEQYFLLTSNVLLLSSRHIGRDAISQRELGSLIGSIPAQKKLVILDTCNAGKGGKEVQIALLAQTRGLTESTAVKLLQRSIGSAVFSASSDSQQALEGYKGHGLFTYVLLEGMRGKADIKNDGFITVLGLADYTEENVVRLSEEVFKRQQTPTIQTGANFPIGRVK
ncbi:MAG: hypothetical protein EG826_04120 [Deltaproteobacteria bacterium]|nr:hypothetical protein [Deltaproteobacteria bacterium]